MPTTPPPSPSRPRSRSAFAAAFLSFIFPGLGQAYAGAYLRGLAFAALPFLSLMLLGGIALRTNRYDLLGFLIQSQVLTGVFVLNIVALLYRLVAVVDAWQVARFLNAADASGGGRLGRARLPLNPISVAGLIAIVLVLIGGHVAVARYDTLALGFVDCVFSEDADTGDPSCDLPDSPDQTNSPDQTADQSPDASSDTAGVPTDSPDVVPTPIASGAVGTPEATLPPWDGKERLNVLLVGSDQRTGQTSFNTDTLIVVSIDPVTKHVAMFQVPRDMVDLPVPANAQSVWGSTYGGKVNSWFTANRNRTDLWAGKNATTRGFNALKAMLGKLYGLDINYYVMVNFQGFKTVVDTLGGVQINVQIPVAESTYPVSAGVDRRIYISAGPQHMTGAQALTYARSRHRAAAGDFDRGRRQQRVLLSLREQMNPQAILANLTSLVNTIGKAVKTDIKPGDVGKLLSLAQGIDTKDIRSYVFAPPFYGSEPTSDSRGYIIVPKLSRIRASVAEAFKVDPQLLALRERLSAEGAQVWVLNASGKSGLGATTADYLAYDGAEASAPNQRPATLASTRLVVYNGAENNDPETVKYLEDLFNVKATYASDAGVPVDMVVTLGRNAPTLTIQAPG